MLLSVKCCLASLVAASALAGCVETPTQLLVFVDTDFPADELDAFGIRVVGPEDEVHDRGTFPLGGSAPVVLPASFGVAPRAGDAARQVLIAVDAIDEGAVLFTTRARTSFVDGQVMRLDLFLARRCRYEAQECPEGETCGPAGCVPIDVPVEELRRPDDEPEGPPPATDWTIWSAGGSSGDVDTDETGAAFVALNVARGGTLEIDGDVVTLGPAADAVIARVEPDGSSPWRAEVRSVGTAVALVSGLVVGDGAVWVVGSGTAGVAVEREGEVLFEHGDPAPLFVLRLTPGGEIEATAVAAGEGAVAVTDVTLSDDGDLAIGAGSQFPGTMLDAAWAGSLGGQGLLIRVAGPLDSAEACPWPESPSWLWSVAAVGRAIATAGNDVARPVARGIAPGCATPWDASRGVVGRYLSVASAPGRPLLVLSDVPAEGGPTLAAFDPATGAWSPGVPLVVDGSWVALRIDADSTGRVLAMGSSDGHVEYDGLVSDPEVPGLMSCFLLGASSELAGLWARRLESDGGCRLWATAPDPATGAVIFVAAAAGTSRFGQQVLGVREGGSLVVHRFIP